MNIWLNIDYHDGGVLTFDPGKILDRVEEYFPQVEIDPTDYGWEEVERLTNFFNEQFAEPNRSSIINSIRGKYRRNSPTYKFKILMSDAMEINGHARRYSVRFACEKVFDVTTEKTIIKLMQSLNYGEITSDTKTEYFCVQEMTFVNKWTLEK
jgi:hypothetical protein